MIGGATAITPHPSAKFWLIAMLFGLIIVTIGTDHLMWLVGLAGICLLIFIASRMPMLFVGAILFLSTNAFDFAGSDSLPYLQLASGMRLNPIDVCLFFLVGLSVARLISRKLAPRFMAPLLLLGLAVVVSFALGLAGRSVTLHDGVNGLRTYYGYIFYIGLVGIIDSRARLHQVVGSIYAILVISVAIQIFETVIGHKITWFGDPGLTGGQATKLIDVGSGLAPYLWNRAPGYLLVGLFIALAGAVRSRKLPLAGIAAVALLGFGLALVRQWYVYLGVGMFVLLAIGSKYRIQSLTYIVALSILLTGAMSVIAVGGEQTTIPVLSALVGRVQSLLSFEQSDHFVSRVETIQRQLAVFQVSPLFGYGPGSFQPVSGGLNIISADTGFPNTLVRLGLAGLAAVAALVAAVVRRGISLFRNATRDEDRDIAAGLLATWTVMVLAYATGQDFFTATELGFATGLVMALMTSIGELDSLEPVGEEINASTPPVYIA